MAVVNRKTEVTKLITVTLGKIQESKHAKCGLNLRKSLLVASVLHKARDIYVTEVKSRVVERVADSTSDSKTCTDSSNTSTTGVVPAKVRRFASQRSMSVIEEEESSQSSEQDQCNAQSTDNSSSVIRPTFGSSELRTYPSFTRQTSETQSAVDDIIDQLATNSEQECAAIDKENSPPSHNVLPAMSCGRCLKRRASTDYPDGNVEESENNNLTGDFQTSPYHSSKKRSRSNTDGNIDSSEERCVSMDTTQINSLVNIFSQSFSDFTSAEVSDAETSAYESSTEMNTFALCRDSIALTA